MAAVSTLVISNEVGSALERGRPVVALESTIIAHGFRYPANLECALTAEAIVREEGAVPATIAVLEGQPVVGLSHKQIERLAAAGPGKVGKLSRRDLGVHARGRLDGATTVSATMLLAERAGIRVFATGGIGGVHRGAQETFDVSADLLELGRTGVCVVCSGAKSVLDIALTLEVLETHGVPVLGFETDEFPAFYLRSSGHAVSARVESAAEVADAISARDELGIEGGIVVANPIPAEHELDAALLDEWTRQALEAAEVEGVRGRAVTPFLLARIHKLSRGASEEANKQLVYSNARLAARIARALLENPA